MPSFSLKKDGEGGDFSRKMNDVFGSLAVLEEKHLKWEDNHVEENEDLIKPDPVIEDRVDNRARVTFDRPPLFKTPFPSYQRKRSRDAAFTSNKPTGYEQNPDKWTKYSLADVSDYEMSDKANTSAAMSFLAERKKIKLDEEEKQAELEKVKFNKTLFRKPKKLDDGASKTEEKMDEASTSGLTKPVHVMPECVVGQGGKKFKKRTAIAKITTEDNEMEEDSEETLTIVPKKPISLGHLEFVNEDDDSDG